MRIQMRIQGLAGDAPSRRCGVSDKNGQAASTATSAAVAVNIAPASTALFPWIAAFNGTVDLVYYGTDGTGKDDPNAVWNVYLAQTTDNGAHFAQSLVSNAPNHMGVICTEGAGCPQPQIPGTRNLLDLFKVAIDPQNGKAAVIYTDDHSLGSFSLPQVVLAQQQ